MRKMGQLVLPRDENGWRIPADGTKSREIYNLMKAGTRKKNIVAMYGSGAASAIWRIRNPDNANATDYRSKL